MDPNTKTLKLKNMPTKISIGTKKNYSYLNPILRSTEQDLVLVSFEPLRYPYISFCFDIRF